MTEAPSVHMTRTALAWLAQAGARVHQALDTQGLTVWFHQNTTTTCLKLTPGLRGQLGDVCGNSNNLYYSL